MHAIRLRHPWQRGWCDSLASTPDLSSGSQLSSGSHLPGAISPCPSPSAPTVRVARYQRSFNCPSGLLPEQNIVLVIQLAAEWQHLSSAEPAGIQSITLNTHPVVLAPQNDRLQTQINDLLQPFNRLEIFCHVPRRFELPPEFSELMEVRLEIS